MSAAAPAAALPRPPAAGLRATQAGASRRGMLRLLLSLAAALLCLPGSLTAHAAESGRTPLPAIEIANPGQCVEPKDVIRRDHMKFLRHQRDLTMHEGIRTKKYSLNECVSCHASKKTGSVLGEGGFCQNCHDYAAVRPDCWDCHQPRVQPAAKGRADAATADLLQAMQRGRGGAETKP